MFGTARPCRHHLTPAQRTEWMGHLCGLCLTLRNEHGQTARATVNVDAVLLSILVEAQRAEQLVRTAAGPCPLRKMRPLHVVADHEPAVLHAAGVSLTMAAAKVADHAADGDGLIGHVPRVGLRIAQRWARNGDGSAERAGFDNTVIHDAVRRSAEREHRPGLGFDAYVAPTEDAAAAAFEHTAVLAGVKSNAPLLREIGRMFGRITYLLDASTDAADDIRNNQFNPLVAVAGDAAERSMLAVELFDDAHARLVRAFDGLALVRPDLARIALVDELRRRRKLLLPRHAPIGRREGVPVRALAAVAVAVHLGARFRPENSELVGGPGNGQGNGQGDDVGATGTPPKRRRMRGACGDDDSDFDCFDAICCCQVAQCCDCCDGCDGCDC